jgi:hypothetical protein
MSDMARIVELGRELEAMGCAVVIFTEEELRGVRPKYVEDRLIELGFEVIDDLARDIETERLVTPSEEDWNWAIK